MEEQRKAAKDQTDAQLKLEQLQVEKERIASQERIAGAQLNAKAMTEQERLQLQKMKDGFQMGKDIAEMNKPQQPKKGTNN